VRRRIGGNIRPLRRLRQGHELLHTVGAGRASFSRRTCVDGTIRLNRSPRAA
jgi:hypothetical protein